MSTIDLTPNPHRDRWETGVEPMEINGLIQARIDGKISRREMLRRATLFGLSAPVGGIMLHLSSDRAYGVAAPGMRHRGTRRAQPVRPEGPTVPPGTVREGGTVACGMRQEPATLHPWRSKSYPTHDVVSGVMEGLLSYDSTQTLRPALAESFSVSEDGLTYTFALRQGVTWHDGGAFTAQDVIDSWSMNMNPDFGSSDQQGWDKIVEARGEGTNLVVVTSEPYAPFISYVGGSHVLCPSSAMAAGPEGFKEQFGQVLVGTGPMRLVEWARGERIVLERYPEYWGGAAKLEQLIFRFLPDDNTQLVQLRTGEIQMAGGAGALDATRVDEALGIENIIILEHQTLGWNHLDLKHVGFLRETAVRQALDFATPTQDIIDQILLGRATRSIGDVAPGTPYFNDQIQPRPYDPEQSKTLLEEAGFTLDGDGVYERDGAKLEIEFWAVAGSATTEQISQVISASWNKAGIKTEVFFEDISTIFGPEGFQFTDKMTAGMYSWFNSNDPDDQFYWHSKFIPTSPTGSGGNTPAYFFQFNFQAEIDDLTQRAAAETDPELRRELYFQVQELLYRELPVIFLYWGKDYPAITPKLGGYWPSAYNRMLWNVKDWYLTE